MKITSGLFDAKGLLLTIEVSTNCPDVLRSIAVEIVPLKLFQEAHQDVWVVVGNIGPEKHGAETAMPPLYGMVLQITSGLLM